jgi:hypothetical protein
MARASRYAESTDELPVEINLELGMDDDVRDRFAINVPHFSRSCQM